MHGCPEAVTLALATSSTRVRSLAVVVLHPSYRRRAAKHKVQPGGSVLRCVCSPPVCQFDRVRPVRIAFVPYSGVRSASPTTMESCEAMPKSDTIKLRNKHIGKSCQLFYRTDPLKIVRGQGQYMYDEQGTRYLDCINNVAHVGHCHPKVVEAGARQLATLSTNNRFLHDELVRCAQTLAHKMPGNLSVCYFVNSGSEANDLALRLARQHTGRHEVITLDHAYHGHVSTVMEISPYKFNQPGGDPKPDFVHVAPCPDVYRGKYRDCDYPEGTDLGELYAQDVQQILDRSPTGVAAFIAESLQSCGGQIIPPPDYFRRVYDAVRKAGGVTIADEVQVGFGRIGTHYWAFEPHGVIPDIVTVAKPMGNGHPVGAVVTTPEIAESFAATGVCYFNTYGGNPVSCAIANAVMRVIDEEGLQENALRVGRYLLEKTRALKREYESVGDVRGTGLFVGIELVVDRARRLPATRAARVVVERMKTVHRTLVSSDGPDDNVVKLKPPMVFTVANADEFLYAFRECLTFLEQQQEQLSAASNATGAAAGILDPVAVPVRITHPLATGGLLQPSPIACRKHDTSPLIKSS